MKVLVLCTGNSCRSQIAEGFLRARLGDGHVVKSAGLNPHGVNSRAIEVMHEIGIDIIDHTSDHLDKYINDDFDYVITVCDNAAEQCPTFPGPAKRLHWPFDDPAYAEGSDEEILQVFRRVRDEIDQKVTSWVNSIEKEEA